MLPTPEQQRQIDAVNEERTRIREQALENARFHERMLHSDGPDVDHRYHAGAIDAYVAILRTIDRNTDWLTVVRTTA